MPGISKIGTHNQGFDVFSISLESDILQAEILNFGATLKDLRFNGFENSIVLGYTSLQDYFSDKNYLGVIIGRYANRISNGQYFFESKEFELDKNEFSTTLHGGSQSCHNAPWKIENYDDDFVELSYKFNDGDMGFGGSLSVKVRYELDGAKLKIIIEARTPQISLCNFTNHSYFNLDYSGNLKNHYLLVKSDEIVEVDNNKLPTGRLLNVGGSKFDFRRETKLSDKHGSVALLDDNFCFSSSMAEPREVAELVASGCKMVLSTTEPGLQVYTGLSLSPPLKPFQGIALEPQLWPDSPNNEGFPNAFLRAGEVYKQVTEYTFSNTYSFK